MRHSPRIVLITGASSGIGLATALHLAEKGWRVWAGARRAESHAEILGQVVARGVPSGSVVPVDLDVTDVHRVEQAVARLLDHEQRAPDAVVANAGIGALGFVEELDDATWRTVFETDFFGAVRTVRAVLPHMRSAGGGHLVLISSNAVNIPHPAFAPYAAAKWAMEGLAEALTLETAPFAIGVTLVQPGATKSGMADRTLSAVRPDSPYQPLKTRVEVGFTRLARGAKDTGDVTAAVARILDTPRPPLRVRVGRDAKLAACGTWFPETYAGKSHAASTRSLDGQATRPCPGPSRNR